jgi:hypothetical protein
MVVLAFSQVGMNFVNGFASYLTRKDYCMIPLEVGEVMMGKAADISNEKVIKIFHNKIELFSGDSIPKDGELEVYLEPPSNQMVLEVFGGGKFVNGGCIGAIRSNTNGAVIKISDDLGSVRLTAAWANSYSSGVQIAAQSFALLRNKFIGDSSGSDL